MAVTTDPPRQVSHENADQLHESGVNVNDWKTGETAVTKAVERHARETLKTYEFKKILVKEQANLEEDARVGGYGRRQLHELVQNATDQLDAKGGRIEVVLTDDALYCANEGRPFSASGVESVLNAHVSGKGDDQIGKFGLGFKSALGVSDRPAVLSRSGSFRFGTDVAARIREVVPDAAAVPLLRIAASVDLADFVARDPVAAELAEWASTVVVLPFRDAESGDWLPGQMADFPAEFLVFASRVNLLVLDDRQSEDRREIAAKHEKDAVVLTEDGHSTKWVVFETKVEVDGRAIEAAGRLAQGAPTVKWAVPPDGTRALGRFWSYFPTHDETTLRGVLNAPWQLGADRLRLQESPYNEQLIAGAVDLIIESLDPVRKHTGDATNYLELLPGRGKEPRCWADGVLTDMANEKLSTRESVPLLDGDLEIPVRAKLHPQELPAQALALWGKHVDPGEWVHHGIETQKDRRARVERYMETAGERAVSFATWFGCLIEEPTPQRGVAAARVAGMLRDLEGAEELAGAAFVLTADLEFVSPKHPDLMLPGTYKPSEGVTLVHPEVADDEPAAAALKGFGLREVSAEVELRRLATAAEPKTDADWERFWALTRTLDAATASSIIGEASRFRPRVRTLAGDFKRMIATLLPGRCIPADGSRDAHAAIDEGWHRDDLRLLQLLGATDGPRPKASITGEPWFDEYASEAIEEFRRVNHPANPSQESIKLMPRSDVPGPLAVVRGLSDEGRAAFVRVALETSNALGSWSVRHATHGKYREASVPNPAVWLFRHEGRLETPTGPRPVDGCVGPELRAGNLSPAPSIGTEVARALGLPATWGEVETDLVDEVIELAQEAEPADAVQLYESLVADEDIAPPELIRCTRGNASELAPPSEVAVSSDSRISDLIASTASTPLIEVSPAAKEAFEARWGLIDARTLVTRRVAAATQSDPVLLVDEFRPLRRLVAREEQSLELQRCDEIRVIEEVVGGTQSEDVAFARDGDRFYCLGDMRPASVLREVSRELGLGLSSDDIARVLKNVEDQKIKDLKRSVRAENDDAKRLLRLCGRDELATELPRAVLDAYEAVHGAPSDLELARLALSVHGTDVLRVHAAFLNELGIDPPGSWSGSRAARQFVRDLGFSGELAGFESDRRPPELIVEGRPHLPSLHDYQQKIVDEMQEVVGRDKNNRAMLTLPTGAGKTRVAIEGLVAAVTAELMDLPLILWIAQTDELCEQAVQSWSEIWRGSDLEERLTISRLWSSNEATPADNGVQVVVATIAKLQNVVEKPGYDWLSRPGCLIVDEAHRATSPAYTKVLAWLGLERGKFGSPLIGLSATPYRGSSETETRRLATRFGNDRLDVRALGQVDHYSYLQEKGVISRVSHEVLRGSEVKLTDAELERLNTTNLMPKAADSRLGEDIERTQRVLESIRELPKDWPILVFAPSVENAQALAGLLTHEGIPSAAIWGEQPVQARRWYLREFRDRNLRVITNYNVLAEGFDAPSVRAVYVARPVYAPARYQQMVGRGLRGPLNGGKEECLIVDVEDNILNFDGNLAFTQFEYLWNPEEAS